MSLNSVIDNIISSFEECSDETVQTVIEYLRSAKNVNDQCKRLIIDRGVELLNKYATVCR